MSNGKTVVRLVGVGIFTVPKNRVAEFLRREAELRGGGSDLQRRQLEEVAAQLQELEFQHSDASPPRSPQ